MECVGAEGAAAGDGGGGGGGVRRSTPYVRASALTDRPN